MAHDTDQPSYWMETSEAESFPRLEEDARAEVAIVGGGIVGLTAAYLLTKVGKDVILLDRHFVAHRDSGHTTAHLTHVVDTPLSTIVDAHGRDAGCLVWEGNSKGMDLIEEIAREADIACDFERVDGVVYASKPQQVSRLEKLHDLAHDIGFRATPFAIDAVPFPAEAALRFPNQARVHPLKYLRGLAAKVSAQGGRIHEKSAVHDVEKGPDGRAKLTLLNGRTVRADHVILASHTPFVKQKSLWARLHPHRSYVVAARIPKGSLADALFWDMEDPFHYVRLQPGDDHDVLMLGGADHPTGHHDDDPQKRWDRLEGMLHQSLDIPFEVKWRWSAQDAGSPDHLAAIGPNPEGNAGELIATAFNGSGITYGTLAAWMLSERIQGRETEWDALFDPRRLQNDAFQEFRQSDEEGMSAYDRRQQKGSLSYDQVEDLQPGEGGIVVVDGETLAISRDKYGNRQALDAKCKHMGCMVRWNKAETSWDCGCHGSRYAPDGAILDGPTAHPLLPVEPRKFHDIMGKLREHGPDRVPKREEAR